jgi:uncharacterized surface protein with fasciclin (FAS1) repeats
MEKIRYILYFLVAIVVLSCEKDPPPAGFKDLDKYSIYDYIKENQEKFSSFLSILEKGELDYTLAAYNPYGTDYTLFLPDNDAINKFISSSTRFSSLDDILKDTRFTAEFCRYHVVNTGIHSSNFPFGAFPDQTLSGDFLTVSFVTEIDTTYFKINNQAAVYFPNIQVSNGFIHLIETALDPINYTTYNWLESEGDYSIFKEAVDLTGFKSILDINLKENDTIRPITLLVESNEVFNSFGIFSVNDLISRISPDDNNYTSSRNSLYNFIGYHILNGNFFIDDFEGVNTNYTTLSDIPLSINGLGINFAINKGKEIFDTIMVNNIPVVIDYIGFFYDKSNILSQSGAIHMIDKMMKQQPPSRATVTFQFYEEPVINRLRFKSGTYLLEDQMNLTYLNWKGAELNFVYLGSQPTSAWNADYLEIVGDFEISYQIPKIIQGRYNMFLGTERFNNQNALIEVFVDGNKLGGFIDLTSGGSANSPFQSVLIGTVVFNTFQTHNIEIKSLIPGRFLWDYVRFVPI